MSVPRTEAASRYTLIAWVILALGALFMALGWWHAIAIKLSIIAASGLLLILFWMWRRSRRSSVRHPAGAAPAS